MSISEKRKSLVKVCSNHTLNNTIDVVIPEAYIPYVPDNWNRVLVIAESQNLSNSNKAYVDKLKEFNSQQKFERLYQTNENLKIEPWDDGTLKIAIESALGVKADETAVSNAVLWSQVTDKKTNKNPSGTINELSSKMWKQFIDLMQPTMIITVGKIAKNVIKNIAWEKEEKEQWAKQIFNLRSPSKTYLSRISGMFNSSDLLHRYPEVRRVIEKHPKWLSKKGYENNKIYYACHAVSTFCKTKKIINGK